MHRLYMMPFGIIAQARWGYFTLILSPAVILLPFILLSFFSLLTVVPLRSAISLRVSPLRTLVVLLDCSFLLLLFFDEREDELYFLLVDFFDDDDLLLFVPDEDFELECFFVSALSLALEA